MMEGLAHRIRSSKVPIENLAIYWLGQAGFAFKESNGRIVFIDPYFSGVVERKFGFKRMMPCPIY